MSHNQMTNPLLSMAATIVMCALLSVCQSTNASTKHVSEVSEISSDLEQRSYISDNHHIHIHGNHENRVYYVDGKEFSYKQLSDDQRKQIDKIHAKMAKLEDSLDLESNRMEEWGDKMEKVADKMEVEAEKMEDAMNSIEFDGHSHSMKEFSEKMEKASRNLEVKMRELEKQMHAMELKMPAIDQQNISDIEEQTEKLEELLIEISDSI